MNSHFFILKGLKEKSSEIKHISEFDKVCNGLMSGSHVITIKNTTGVSKTASHANEHEELK